MCPEAGFQKLFLPPARPSSCVHYEGGIAASVQSYMQNAKQFCPYSAGSCPFFFWEASHSFLPSRTVFHFDLWETVRKWRSEWSASELCVLYLLLEVLVHIFMKDVLRDHRKIIDLPLFKCLLSISSCHKAWIIDKPQAFCHTYLSGLIAVSHMPLLLWCPISQLRCIIYCNKWHKLKAAKKSQHGDN